MTWGIAGGWALDLALGRVTREHRDLDIAVFREDQARLQRALPGWTFEVIVRGDRRSWPIGEWLAPPAHEIIARSNDDTRLHLEFLLNEREHDDWVFRRDPAIHRPLREALIATRAGLPALAPEIVLLYKAKDPRPNDERDFAAVYPYLGDEPRAWLRTALDHWQPGHPWCGELSRSSFAEVRADLEV